MHWELEIRKKWKLDNTLYFSNTLKNRTDCYVWYGGYTCYLKSIKNCAYLSKLGSTTKPLVMNLPLLELQIINLEVVKQNLRYWKLERMEASITRSPSLQEGNSMKL